jgi:hypothetical protein
MIIVKDMSLNDVIQKVYEYGSIGCHEIQDSGDIGLVRDIENMMSEIKNCEKVKEKIITDIVDKKTITEHFDERSNDHWYHIIYTDANNNSYVFYSSTTDFSRCPYCGSTYNDHEENIPDDEKFWIYRKFFDRRVLIPVRKVHLKEEK